MTNVNTRRPIALLMAAVLYTTALTPASAQVAVSAPRSLAAPQSSEPQQPSSDFKPLRDEVLLSEQTPVCRPAKVKKGEDPYDHCQYPRAARPSTISEDTPKISRERFLARYPNAGEKGYQLIAQSNRAMCGEAGSLMGSLVQLDELYGTAENAYLILTDAVNQLPDEIRRNTRIMQVSQAASAGFLCVLTLGLYCAAVAVTSVGNVAVAEASKNAQLINVRATLLNILATRMHIFATRVHSRFEGLWIKLAMPFCTNMGYPTITGLSPLSPLSVTADDFKRVEAIK